MNEQQIKSQINTEINKQSLKLLNIGNGVNDQEVYTFINSDTFELITFSVIMPDLEILFDVLQTDEQEVKEIIQKQEGSRIFEQEELEGFILNETTEFKNAIKQLIMKLSGAL